jgi:hypothetical protein
MTSQRTRGYIEMKVANCCSVVKGFFLFYLNLGFQTFFNGVLPELELEQPMLLDVDKLHGGADKKKQTSGETMSKRLV